jgi:hypothetical protein
LDLSGQLWKIATTIFESEVQPLLLVNFMKQYSRWEMVNYISPWQRADCWIGDNSSDEKPNLFTSSVLFFKAAPSPKRFYMWEPSSTHDAV